MKAFQCHVALILLASCLIRYTTGTVLFTTMVFIPYNHTIWHWQETTNTNYTNNAPAYSAASSINIVGSNDATTNLGDQNWGASYYFGGAACNDTVIPALPSDDYKVSAFVLLPWPSNSGQCREADLFARALSYSPQSIVFAYNGAPSDYTGAIKSAIKNTSIFIPLIGISLTDFNGMVNAIRYFAEIGTVTQNTTAYNITAYGGVQPADGYLRVAAVLNPTGTTSSLLLQFFLAFVAGIVFVGLPCVCGVHLLARYRRRQFQGDFANGLADPLRIGKPTLDALDLEALPVKEYHPKSKGGLSDPPRRSLDETRLSAMEFIAMDRIKARPSLNKDVNSNRSSMVVTVAVPLPSSDPPTATSKLIPLAADEEITTVVSDKINPDVVRDTTRPILVHRQSIISLADTLRRNRSNRKKDGDTASIVSAAPTIETCAICIEPYDEGEQVRVLPCNHFFHAHCVDTWLKERAAECPICRMEIRPSRPSISLSRHRITMDLEREAYAYIHGSQTYSIPSTSIAPNAAATLDIMNGFSSNGIPTFPVTLDTTTLVMTDDELLPRTSRSTYVHALSTVPPQNVPVQSSSS